LIITASGDVPEGCNWKWTECSSPNPFVMKLTAYNGKCSTDKMTFVLIEDVTAKPFKFQLPTEEGEKGYFEFEMRGRIALTPTING